MASTDARPLPIKNTAYRVTFPIFDADGDLVTGAAGLDSEVSKDGATFADCTNEATEIATSSGMYYLDLTATEMNADTVAVIVKTSTSGAKTTPIILYPVEAGDIDVDVTSWNGTAVATPDTAGYPKVTIKDGTGAGELDTSSGLVTLTTASRDAIADQVWDEAKSGHTAAGSFGEEVQAHALTSELPAAAPSAASIADAVWDEAISGHTAGGSFGEEVQAHALTSELPSAPPSAATIADAVWDEALAGHAGGGTAGAALAGASAPSAATVADAVWDEALSGHSSAGTAGKALADAGTAGDPWNTALPGAYTSGKAGYILGTNLDMKISNVDTGGTAGAGAIMWEYTLTSTVDSSPIPDADVWVTTDALGTTVIASGRTDGDGLVTFYLDAGTYYFWRQKRGWDFTNPDTEIVA